ncbi:sigma-70 family RNA polymerase sigma factor [Pontibacillus halophilus]|uniref:sigma-70 family RNA polymerase sigma factor n=1 Tax=Pontibacillus halophilus TaxID=516704 RepID=UPI000684FA40|nr:sigma-70 family RNA polymerase sigma factor [Pontibacillus halophilus]
MELKNLVTGVNEEKLNNPIVVNFLEQESNQLLYERYKLNPSNTNKKALDRRFKEYFREIKLISYINKLIYHYSIDFDKKVTAKRDKFQLTLDKPMDTDKSTSPITMRDTISIKDSLDETDFSLQEFISNLDAYKTWRKLNTKQKKILTLKYKYQMNDKEVSEFMGESKQVVSYNHNKALLELKKSYGGKGKNVNCEL